MPKANGLANISERVWHDIDYGDLRTLAEGLGIETMNADWAVGDDNPSTHKTITFRSGAGKIGKFRYNKDTNKIQFSNDGGTSYADVGTGGAPSPIQELPVVPEPPAPAGDTMAIFVMASGLTPTREIKYCVKGQTGRVTVLSSIIV